MSVVLLSGDLMVVSRVEGAAARAGTQVRAAATASQAIEHCSSAAPTMLIVDLSLNQLDVAGLIEALEQTASDRPRVVAFGPHVHEQRLGAAREAGCDEVMSRGEFFAKLDAIIGG